MWGSEAVLIGLEERMFLSVCLLSRWTWIFVCNGEDWPDTLIGTRCFFIGQLDVTRQ